MKIIYKNANWREGDSDTDILGIVEHTDFHEMLVPFYENGHAVSYISRKFNDYQHITIWEVVDVVFNGNTFEVSLIETVSPSSLAAIAEKRNQKINKLVSKYCLVEVDFGHKANLGGVGGIVGNNTWDVSTHLPAEMYKKRPCVVLDIDGSRIQVVPISTSVRTEADNFHVELTAPSFNKLHSRYRSKPSYILTTMIQTVSAYRVYPPKLATRKFAPSCNPYKLCSADKANLLKKLTLIYGHALVQENEALERRLDRLSTERGKLLESKAENDRNALRNKQYVTDLEEKIIEVGKQFDVSGSVEEVLKGLLS